MRTNTVKNVGHKPAVHSVGSEGLEKLSAAVWSAQGHGLALLTLMSFFPRLSHVSEYLFVTLLVAAVGLAWRQGARLWHPTPVDLPVWLLVGWVLLSLPFATDPVYSFAEWRKLLIKVVMFYWALLVLRHERDGATTRSVLYAVVAGTLLLASYALWDFVAHGGSWRDREVRAAAPSSDYNWLSTYMIMTLPLLAVLAMGTRERLTRLTCLAAAALGFAAEVFSYTRAAWLGLFAQGVAFGLWRGRRTVTLGILSATLVLAVAFVAVSQFGYHRVTVSPETWDFRLMLWEKGMTEVVHHPVFGVGYGNDTFSKRFGNYGAAGVPAGLHNMFLMVALGSGIPALVFLGWFLARAVWTLLSRARRSPEEFSALLMAGVALMIIGLAVRNFFDYMFAGSIACLFWILLAVGNHQALRWSGRGFEKRGV